MKGVGQRGDKVRDFGFERSESKQNFEFLTIKEEKIL